MRIRLPELMEKRGLTRYALAKQSGGRISLSTAYRLVEMEGDLETFGNAILEALCDVLQVEPSELFERDGATAKPVKKAAAKRRKA